MVDRTWTNHIKDSKGKEEFAKYILHSGGLLDRLEDIIDGYIAEIRRGEQTEDYSSASWPYLQADRLGQLKSLTKIRKLLQRKEKDLDE